MKINKINLLLLLVVILALFFRLYAIVWDQGFHLHPDERAIILFTLPLQFPHSLSQFLNSSSSWNPHFFAYGSFPLYFLKIMSMLIGFIIPSVQTYTNINILGRLFSALFDTGTLIVLYFIGKKIQNKIIGLLSSFFYAISVFPIQVSHFYAVDTLLTFFTTLVIFLLLSFYENPSYEKALLIGIFFGLGIATKDSALALLAAIGISLSIDFLLLFFQRPYRIQTWYSSFKKLIEKLLQEGVIISVVTIITFFIFEPYAFIDFSEFWTQTMQQNAMTKSAFVFPYTLQYVGIIPYWYEIKNVFLWGLGPILAIICFLGFLYCLWTVIKNVKDYNPGKDLIILSFVIGYFLVVGHFAVGFMRYMMPLYPFFALFGAMFFYLIFSQLKKVPSLVRIVLAFFFALILLVWPLSFLTIYSIPNTRILASAWITENIPPGSTIAIEAWDDGLPLWNQETYTIETLPLYDPDTSSKWVTINNMVAKADYIIVASNRLYVPLQKLTNCTKLPVGYCYPLTASYYEKLFSGKLGFKEVAQFTDYPKIPLTDITINDFSADESFTVYDHPKIMVFKRIP